MDQKHSTRGDAHNLRERFALLLSGLSTLAARSQSNCSPQVAGIRAFLERFKEVHERGEATERVEAAEDQRRIDRLLDGYRRVEQRYRLRQAHCADDFNLLDVLQLTGSETRHGRVLAWLLDHDLRRLGTHAQGKLGFHLFLEEFGLPLCYADTNYWVRRELRGEESIVDVEVACRQKFLIHIESKIWSEEGTDQTHREWADVLRRTAQLELNGELALRAVHALYLTPQGTKPVNPNFVPISWGRIADVFKRFAEHAQPEDVKLFARHYARTLRRFIVTCDRSEDRDDQTDAE